MIDIPLQHLCQKNLFDKLSLWHEYADNQRNSFEFNYFPFVEHPLFISEIAARQMQETSLALLDALTILSELVLNNRIKFLDRPLLDFLEIPNHIFYWIKRRRAQRQRLLWGRPDFILGSGRPMCIEANFASAAGYQMQVSSLARYYANHPVLSEASELQNALLFDPLETLSQSIGRLSKPSDLLLIPDTFEKKRHPDRDKKPYSGMIKLLTERFGIRCQSAFLEDLDYETKGVFSEGLRADAIFMSYYNPHDFSKFVNFLPLHLAAEESRLQILDGLDEILLSNKTLFAFLSEFIDELPLTVLCKQLLSNSIPWTRIVEDRTTVFEGKNHSLYTLLSEHKDFFVLKKAQSAEGKDVFMGHSHDENSWKLLLECAFSEPGWVVQRQIASDAVEVSTFSMSGPNLNLTKLDCVVSPYLCSLSLCGFLARFYRSTPESSLSSPKSIHESAEGLIGACAVI